MGPREGIPVLLLHGGPGAACDYMLPLAERLAEWRGVVVYDQLGCGRSDHPDDPELWTMERAVQEVDQVRAALGLDRCHLLGQSWGGWLSIEYMVGRPPGIEKLVLASTSASIPQFMAEARKLIEALPEPHRTVLIDLGAQGAYDHPDYQAAVGEFYRRHLCRLDPWPDALVRSSEQMDGNQVYLTMNGPTEFDVIGRLREWDRTADLHRIRVPTLVTCGRYDEIAPPAPRRSPPASRARACTCSSTVPTAPTSRSRTPTRRWSRSFSPPEVGVREGRRARAPGGCRVW